MASTRPARRRIACIEKLVLLALQLAAMVRIWQLMNTFWWPGREAGAALSEVGQWEPGQVQAPPQQLQQLAQQLTRRCGHTAMHETAVSKLLPCLALRLWRATGALQPSALGGMRRD